MWPCCDILVTSHVPLYHVPRKLSIFYFKCFNSLLLVNKRNFKELKCPTPSPTFSQLQLNWLGVFKFMVTLQVLSWVSVPEEWWRGPARSRVLRAPTEERLSGAVHTQWNQKRLDKMEPWRMSKVQRQTRQHQELGGSLAALRIPVLLNFTKSQPKSAGLKEGSRSTSGFKT